MNLRNGFLKLAVPLLVLVLLLACALPDLSQEGTQTAAPTEPPAATEVTSATVVPSLVPPTDTATPEPTSITLPLVVSPAFRLIDRIDEDYGWGLTADKVAITADGGSTWYDVSIVGVSDYSRALAFVLDADHGWVLVPEPGDMSGSLYRTADRGITWTASAFNYPSGQIHFLDALHGYAMIGLGAGAGSMAVAVVTTSDGGATWSQVFHNHPTVAGANDSLPLGGIKNGVTYRDTTYAWLTGAKPQDGFVYLYRSIDGGANWAQQGLVLPTGMESAMVILRTPVFHSTSNALLFSWLMTPADNLTYVYRSTDGGETWTAGTPIPPARSITSSDASNIWSWHETGLYHSPDSGVSWTLLSPGLPGASDSVMLDFVSGGYGWALLRDGDDATPDALMGTNDGGQNWITLAP